MKSKDLINGDLIEFENGKRCIVVGGNLIGDTYFPLDDYPDLLKNGYGRSRVKSIYRGNHNDERSRLLNSIASKEPIPSKYIIWSDGKNMSVFLNNDYTAKIKEGEVEVGCQSFSFEKVEELYNAIQEHKKDQ